MSWCLRCSQACFRFALSTLRVNLFPAKTSDLPSKASTAMSHCHNPADSASSPLVGALTALLRSRGIDWAAIIDGHAFFRTAHSPAMHCASITLNSSAVTSVRPVQNSADLEAMSITESVRRFVEQPGQFCSQSNELERAFLSEWTAQVAQASSSPQTVDRIFGMLLEVERWLSDDGPGACVLLTDWIIWAVGRHGLSDLHIARNLGARPNPIMSTGGRWDGISAFDAVVLDELARQLEEWMQSPSVWSFPNRRLPAAS